MIVHSYQHLIKFEARARCDGVTSSRAFYLEAIVVEPMLESMIDQNAFRRDRVSQILLFFDGRRVL